LKKKIVDPFSNTQPVSPRDQPQLNLKGELKNPTMTKS
jgi:hypothetical protein